MSFTIGVDARELEGKPTGVGTYLFHILERITVPKGSRLELYFKNEIPACLPNVSTETILLKSEGSNLLWQQTRLSRELRKRKTSLLFSPSGSCPWRFHGKQAISIHDLSFFRYPEWFSQKERLARQIGARIAMRKANRIYVLSDHVRHELISTYHISDSRIRTATVGVIPKQNHPEKREELRRQYGMEKDRVVLYVGSIFNRRHLPVLIEAMSLLEPEYKLVVIGENRTHPFQDLAAECRKFGVADRVKFLEYVPDSILQDYYSLADVFVYLSTYEGFGIPPLEAMSYGVPVIVSRTPAMDTIFQDAACFVNAFSAMEVRRAIETCLQNPQERQHLIEAGLRLAARHDWQIPADVISEDWEQILGQS